MELLEERAPICMSVTRQDDPKFVAFRKYSNYTRLIRVIAYCPRFCRTKSKNQPNYSLNRSKIDFAENAIEWLQLCTFKEEIADISECLARSSSINLFLNNWEFLRMGGRLDRADMPYNQQHPIILPKGKFITKFIVRCEHEHLLHAGCKLRILSFCRRYWPLAARNTIRGVLRKCIQCNRAKFRDTTTWWISYL